MNEDNIVGPPQVPDNTKQPETFQPTTAKTTSSAALGQNVLGGQQAVMSQSPQITTAPAPQPSVISSDPGGEIPTAPSLSSQSPVTAAPISSYAVQSNSNAFAQAETSATVTPVQQPKPHKNQISHKKLLIFALVIIFISLVIAGVFLISGGSDVEAPKTTDPSVTKVEEDTSRADESNKQAAEAAAKQAAVQDIDSLVSTLDSTISESNDAVDFSTSSISATTVGVE
ncbi:hypothetical protein KA068_01770 [Candidatus Saccharibacteria bacterium]|nr:hypothetical protein [Candidatus Saccharibacteria bacterium]